MTASCDTLIRNALVIDGSGNAPFTANVALHQGRIVAIGELEHWRAPVNIDATGLVLSPGFIDVHTHDDTNVIRMPEMWPKLSQGVTTVIVGNCGISAAPVTLAGDPPDPMNLLGTAEVFNYPSFADYVEAVNAARPASECGGAGGPHCATAKPDGYAGPRCHRCRNQRHAEPA